MPTLKQYELAESVDRDLGDPWEDDSVLSFKYIMQADELEEFPVEAVDWLYQRQLAHCFVPAELGGRFTSFEELAGLIRVLSRRDLTTSITFSTLFWSFLTWMGGTEDQKQRLANYIMEENGAMCLAYSERGHGSDLINGETVADRIPGGFLLNGEKWPINRATVAKLCYVLATTAKDAGPRSLSLFMLEKKYLNPSNFSHLPKIRTLGIRGSDMSGIRFESCEVADKTLIGKEGLGLELALKGFQVTRTLCAAFSLGAADTALRTTLRFAMDRELYGHRVINIPHARKVLTDAFVDILTCDCVATAAMRGFHVVPEQFSVWSAVVKYFVPTTMENMIQKLSVVLGARYYLREEHDLGIFQKVARDCAIISVFDGSTVVNLHALLLQLRHLARLPTGKPEERECRLTQIFTLDKPVSRFEPERLMLISRHANEVWYGLDIAMKHLDILSAGRGLDSDVLKALTTMANSLAERLREHQESVREVGFEPGHLHAPKLFELAREYCLMHAAVTCFEMWIWNRDLLGNFFAEGRWLVLAMHKLLRELGLFPNSAPADECLEPVAEQLVRLHEQNQLFSIVDVNLS